MSNYSGVKKIADVLCRKATDIIGYIGGRREIFTLDENRKYVIPGYQREIRWSPENVQILIDDLCLGKKFLGTVTLSTAEEKIFEVIDGQQRLTVITMLVTYLNSFVEGKKKFTDLCKLENGTFGKFNEALDYGFDYEIIEKENKKLLQEIDSNDPLFQKKRFRLIWNSIKERVDGLSDLQRENLLRALLESDLNLIVNRMDGTPTQRKFCIDYFIDINNKSVHLDSLDIIRAYAFKEDFDEMASKWIIIQTKCNNLQEKVKYTCEMLYYHYFLSRVNEQVKYNIIKLKDDYTIVGNVYVDGKKYSTGTFVWNMFKNDKYYSQLLAELIEYLKFIELVVSIENGGCDEYKQYFKKEDGVLSDETRILNSHTIINNILRNDDIVPKMMVMKYFLEILKPEKVKSKRYKLIYDIGLIASLFTTSKRRKGSDQIANRILQFKWEDAIKQYAYKMALEASETIDFSKIASINRKYTVESGQYAARRYFSLYDAYSWSSGNISVDENKFKNSTITTGKSNIEHFLINRKYEYVLYLDDEKTEEVRIELPKKYKKNIATIANYIILDGDVNARLKNRPVYEKIEILEEEIEEKSIDVVIPSDRSQKHYYLIKKIFHDLSKYPVKELQKSKSVIEKEKWLNYYYGLYFNEEFTELASSLANDEKVFVAEMEYYLLHKGFIRENTWLVWKSHNIFSDIRVDINSKTRSINVETELFNPFYAEEGKKGDDKYARMIDFVEKKFIELYGEVPYISSSNEYGGSEDESFSFEYNIGLEMDKLWKFIDVEKKISILLDKG